MSKTAMQILLEWINECNPDDTDIIDVRNKISTELLDKEKEQLRHSFLCGDNAVFHYPKDYNEDFKTFVEYYQKTYTP